MIMTRSSSTLSMKSTIMYNSNIHHSHAHDDDDDHHHLSTGMTTTLTTTLLTAHLVIITLLAHGHLARRPVLLLLLHWVALGIRGKLLSTTVLSTAALWLLLLLLWVIGGHIRPPSRRIIHLSRLTTRKERGSPLAEVRKSPQSPFTRIRLHTHPLIRHWETLVCSCKVTTTTQWEIQGNSQACLLQGTYSIVQLTFFVIMVKITGSEKISRLLNIPW